MNNPTLPRHIRELMTRLEQAGYEAWAVGGCVRDAAMGRLPHDYDLCTDALPERTEAVFAGFPLLLSGKKHGTVTVLLPEGPVEITTYRTEGDYADHRHPGWVKFVTGIREDLARRDFTVNAMAFHPERGFLDPFGGLEDLKNGVLRTVGDPERRFREDALRILRGVRFAVRYGLTPEEGTRQAMNRLTPLMEELAAERVFAELCRILPGIHASELTGFAPVITGVIPELAAAVGFDQRSPYHDFDLYTHIAHVVEGVPESLPLRFAALLHDVGKPAVFTVDETGRGHFFGHAEVGADMADQILRRLKAPTRLREQTVFLIRHHMTVPGPDKKLLRRWVSRWGAENVRLLLQLQRADRCGKGTPFDEDLRYFDAVEALLEQVIGESACLTLGDLAISGRDLLDMGYPAGKALGECLRRLLDEVLAEKLPNQRSALLREAEKQKKFFEIP